MNTLYSLLFGIKILLKTHFSTRHRRHPWMQRSVHVVCLGGDPLSVSGEMGR